MKIVIVFMVSILFPHFVLAGAVCDDIQNRTEQLMKSPSLESATDGLVIAKSSEASKCDPDKLGLFKEVIADIFFSNKTNYYDAVDIYLYNAANESNHLLYGHSRSKLAYMYLSGIYFDKNESEAVRFYKDAAYAGDPEALYFVGKSTYNGWFGMPKNPEAGFNILKTLADAGVKTSAMRDIGGAYLTGIGVIKNTKNGLKYLNMAAMRGDTESQKNLGVLYSTLDDSNRNAPVGYAWLLIYQSHGYDEEMYKFTSEQERITTQSDKEKGIKIAAEIAKKIQNIQ